MENNVYQTIVDYKCKGQYPLDSTKTCKKEIRRKASTYVLDGGALYYMKGKATKTKVVRGAEEENAIFRDFHDSATGAHTGQHRTRDAMSKRFFWPGMSSDIHKWVSECAVCQAAAHPIKQEVEYTPIKVEHPFELIGMDLIGRLKTTNSGNVYICVMVDYLTKWPQAYPLKTKTATEINKNVCAKMGIQRSLCSPYHPQTNELVERMNGTIQRALRKLVADKPEDWDEYLDAVMFGLRTKKQMTTKFSPYFLMFGREVRYPTEVPEHFMVDSSVEDVVAEEKVSQGVKNLEEIKDILHGNISKQEKSTRERLTKGIPKCHFRVGDQVLHGSSISASLTCCSISLTCCSIGPTCCSIGPTCCSISLTCCSIGPTCCSIGLTCCSIGLTCCSIGLTCCSNKYYVQEAWAGKDVHVLLSKIGPYKLFFWDITNTGPNKELESEVINAYLTLIVRKFNQCNDGQAAVIDSYAMTAIWKHKFGRIRVCT
ncbi:hypothetical protein KUCAC02_021198 [Chaenocephalus aceratus]|uniref:Uncharacterized protein n=1 Tax=Chaenocephalus aceratus TaxID=36190 RepID=A0ACB9XGS4_CHAAC|nr:hypothetical protein KUCAC02_021198 [Chaenocephalus aceratus]